MISILLINKDYRFCLLIHGSDIFVFLVFEYFAPYDIRVVLVAGSEGQEWADEQENEECRAAPFCNATGEQAMLQNHHQTNL